MLELKQFGDQTWFEGTAGDWHLKYRMKPGPKGKWVISEIRIARRYHSWRETLAPLPDDGLTKRVLSALPIPGEVRCARAAIAEQTWWPSTERRRQRPVRPAAGRPELSIAYYCKVARHWNARVKARDPHPAKSCALKFNTKRSTMRAILHRYDALAMKYHLRPRTPW